MQNATLERIVACPNLPSLPSVAVQVLELTRNEDVHLMEIARVVQHDPALAAKLLRTANSSYYGLPKSCPTVSRAIMYLGLNAVKSLVLGFSLMRVADPMSELTEVMNIWRRALFTAAASRRIATLHGLCDPEEAFLAALMQDIGMLAIHAALDRQYLDLVRQAGNDHPKLAVIERDALGFDHTVVGDELGKRWKLPEQVIEAIRHHHDLQPVSHHHLVRSVGLGGMFADIVIRDDENARSDDLQRISTYGEAWFDFNLQQAKDILATLTGEASQLAMFFEVDLGTPCKVDAAIAEAQEASQQHILRVSHETERLRRDNVELARKAQIDRLTGLANRCKFDDAMSAMFLAAQKQQHELAIVLIDIDHFKPLNDSMGHLVGDAVLTALGYRLQQTVPSDGVACRYGGEEFVLLVPQMTRNNAAVLAEQVRQRMESTPIDISNLPVEQKTVSATVSVGVAVLDDSNARMLTRSKLLFAAADRALYAAKHAGRNCVRIFSATPSSTFESALYESIEDIQAQGHDVTQRSSIKLNSM